MKPAAETAAANAMPGRSPMISATSLWYGSTGSPVTRAAAHVPPRVTNEPYAWHNRLDGSESADQRICIEG